VDQWLHFFHVLGACAWLGGGLILVAIGLRLRRSNDPTQIAEFGAAVRYAARVLGPAWIVVLVSGVLMVLTNSEWDFSQVWVLIGLGLFALAFLVGIVFVAGTGTELVKLSRTNGREYAAGNLNALVRRWLVGYGLVLACLLLAVWDMVFKPGLTPT
jgi:uncharacterized membrane protein